MSKVYFIKGGFQALESAKNAGWSLTVNHGTHSHATDCLENQGIGGQLFYTGLAWSESFDSLMKAAKEYFKFKKSEIEIVEEDEDCE